MGQFVEEPIVCSLVYYSLYPWKFIEDKYFSTLHTVAVGIVQFYWLFDCLIIISDAPNALNSIEIAGNALLVEVAWYMPRGASHYSKFFQMFEFHNIYKFNSEGIYFRAWIWARINQCKWLTQTKWMYVDNADLTWSINISRILFRTSNT